MKKDWKTYGLWILGTEAVGALSGFVTKDAQKAFNETARQPPLSPPAIVFPIVWGLLYALMGVSAARVDLSPASARRQNALHLYWIQLVINFFWSLIFFNAQAYGFATIWLALLWAMVVWMILLFYRVDKAAGWLQIPYLLWLTFAMYLCTGVWLLNR